jgi:hypothetical protein
VPAAVLQAVSQRVRSAYGKEIERWRSIEVEKASRRAWETDRLRCMIQGARGQGDVRSARATPKSDFSQVRMGSILTRCL